MLPLGRWLTVFVLVAALPTRAVAAAAVPTEKGAFEAAAKAFQDRAYAKAESEFSDFTQRYTNSARVPEAVLFQAEARILQTNYPGAIELLSSRLPQAGRWTDSFLFWLAEAHFRAGDYTNASVQFSNLLTRFPTTPRRLEAALTEVTARSRLGQWQQVVELLQQTNGVFQTVVRASPTNELALRGYLILSEAHLAQDQPAAARAALKQLEGLPLSPRLSWHRQYLDCRIHLAQQNPELALAGVTNLLILATNSSDIVSLSTSLAFQGGLLERLGFLDQAMQAYERNLADAIPPERQREALLKIANVALAKQRIADAARMLERFCANYPQAVSRDQALLSLGELRLRQRLVPTPATAAAPTNAPPPGTTNLPPAAGTNAPALTNYLQAARTALEALIKEYPESPFVGKAWLSLGWCHWLDQKFPPAHEAFEKAAQVLPESHDHAIALFKLADAQFRLGDPAGAITNYQALLTRYEKSAPAREELFEPALYQLVRAGIVATNFEAATDALARILRSFPSSFHTERAVLIAGEALAAKGNPAQAREIYLQFSELVPNAPLLPEVRLAIARTYEQENAWKLVISEYDSWLERFTNSPARPRAEYLRAWASFQAGLETNAFTQLTNFLARYPKDERAPLAQWWVADYYSRSGRSREAEENYQLLYQSTNWPRSELSYQAQIMAGRTAVARQGWSDAIRYFTSLTSDPKCPPTIWVQATLAYGNVLVLQDSTNKLGDYMLATGVYDSIAERFPTNPVAVLALGEKASCLLQWARTAPQFDAAALEFNKVLTNRLADATVRGIARVGLGVLLEKQAQQKTGADQQNFLRRAQDSYLDAFYYEKDLREGERPDPFWVQKAGLEAARMAETLQDWPQAIKIYERLLQLLPPVRPALEKKLAKAQETLTRAKP